MKPFKPDPGQYKLYDDRYFEQTQKLDESKIFNKILIWLLVVSNFCWIIWFIFTWFVTN